MEKLGQFAADRAVGPDRGGHPASRSALDFLDAPQRLSRFLDGRLIKLLTAPTRAGGRAYLKVVNVSFSVSTGIVTKVLGAQVLRTCRPSSRPSTRCSVGSGNWPRTPTGAAADAGYGVPGGWRTPEPDALREASYFVERLSEDRMPLAGLILNACTVPRLRGWSAARSQAAAEALLPVGGPADNAHSAGSNGGRRGTACRRDAVPARRGRAPAARRADALIAAERPVGAAVLRGTPGCAGGEG